VITIDLTVEAGDWEKLGDLEALAQRAASAAVGVIPKLDGDLEVALLFTDDAAMREINKDWRDQDKPTNVLSFPAAAHPGMPGPRHIGDVVLAFETTQREAGDEGKTIEAHVSHLIVHGVLHCLGYDHESDEQAEAMEALEISALKRIGYADPYEENAA
jgi:probable rRNA maturation factor